MRNLLQIYLLHGTTCTEPLNTMFSGMHTTPMCQEAGAIYALCVKLTKLLHYMDPRVCTSVSILWHRVQE